MTCGVPDTSLLSKFVDQRFTGLTWNASALWHHDAKVRQAKMAYLDPKILSSTVVGLQEVHGGAVDAQVLFQKFNATHFWHHNPAEDPACGGNSTLISKEFSLGAAVTHEDIVAG
eukprot:3072066-Karenia_brevis.AAC.1